MNCCSGISRATQRGGLVLEASLEQNSPELFWWAELFVRDTARAVPAPQAPGRGSSISGFISYFQVPGCHTDTETRREPMWEELQAQSSVHEALGVPPELAGVSWGGHSLLSTSCATSPLKEQLDVPNCICGVLAKARKAQKKGWLFL